MLSFLQDNSTYIAVLLGLIIGIPVIHLWNISRRKTSIKQEIFHGVVFTIISVLSVLLFASLESLLSTGEFKFGAVSTFGVYLIAPLLLIIIYRKSRSEIFDEFAIYAIPSLFLQRIRCILAGCCGGKLIGNTSMHWPTRGIELVFYIAVFVLFMRLNRQGKVKEGMFFPILMVLYGALRFIVEFMRDNGNGFFHEPHIWAMLTLIIGISVVTEMKGKSAKYKTSKK